MDEVETTVATETVEQPEVSMEQPQEGASQAEQEILDWTQDKRAKTMWKEDVNQLYGSYRNMEKMYNPLKQQVDQLNNVFKEYGVETDKIGDVLKEYKSYVDPQAPVNQWLSYIGKHLNGEFKDDVIKFFNDMDRRYDQKKYGENLPDHVIEQLKKVEALEARQREIEEQEAYQREYQQTMQTIESKLSEVEQLAKQYDVDWDDETKNGFIQYCSQNNIPPQYMNMAFSQLALDAVQKSAGVKAERQVVNNLQSNKKAGITTKSVTSPVQNLNKSFRDKIAEQIGFDSI